MKFYRERVNISRINLVYNLYFSEVCAKRNKCFKMAPENWELFQTAGVFWAMDERSTWSGVNEYFWMKIDILKVIWAL